MIEVKKKTMKKKHKYYPETQKRYSKKVKTLSCKVFNEYQDRVFERMDELGFISTNSYLKHLIDKDLEV